MTDWNHRSVFEDWPIMLNKGTAPEMTNILMNGTGQFGWGPQPKKYALWFKPGKRHMLILINTSVDTTFVFSIDNHKLEVIEMDFVPIVPYETDHIKVGIGTYLHCCSINRTNRSTGQRYHVIVKGLDNPEKAERYGNYWMRAVPARKCSKFAFGPDQQMGIIRYNTKYVNDPLAPDPLSEPPLYDIACADEPYESLIPHRHWTVRDPANIGVYTCQLDPTPILC
jgi:hypothetical protein